MDLPDATNKESLGWAQHILGLKNAKIDFTTLFNPGLITDTPPVPMSAKALMDYILNSETLLITILGLGDPIVGEADMTSLSFDAPLGNTMTLAGSLNVNGPLYSLSGTMTNMNTIPDQGGVGGYSPLTVIGIKITEATSAGGAAYCMGNTISVTNGGVYKLALFLTHALGQVPSVALYDNTSADISNVVALVNGLNLVTLTSTSNDASASLRFRNSAATSWSTSDIYLFKV
jgi:hypothetical protein